MLEALNLPRFRGESNRPYEKGSFTGLFEIYSPRIAATTVPILNDSS
jgi:hypothetical protein